MASWDLGALARAAEGHSPGGGLPKEVQAVGTDTRSLPSGSLFVALRGERFDGHAFLQQAADGGAIAAVVDRDGVPPKPPMPLIVVDDTLVALGRIARYVRRTHSGPVVGVTGSNGKTTTKELIARAISPAGEPHKTQGNLNNRIGVPFTLFDWSQQWAAVVEMGMNEPGEIAELTRIAEPNVGVITVVGPAHIEKLGSIENIARAKGELFQTLSPDSVAVVNADDALIETIAVPLLRGQRVVRFGQSENAEIRLSSAEADGESTLLSVEVRGASHRMRLPLAGVHNAMNAAAALACAVALDIDPGEAAQAMEQVSLPGSRLVIRRDLGPGVSILDDSYNANPQSMSAAFQTLQTLSGGRRIAVLGDMLELGDQARPLHRDTGDNAVASGISWVLALGQYASDVAEGANAAGGRGDAFVTMDALLAALDAELRPGDWLVVKGSRGMRMERVVRHLEGGES
ncbi:MAG: UDP-N-acetylmuramoyl-tripeptide--D-alanyl-D-alanine ligase [Myxococcota bacterium]